MTRFAIVLLIVLLMVPAVLLPFAARQAPADAKLQGQLKTVFPSAASFSTKQTTPLPHFVAYAADGKTVLGYAFWTTELEPLERGYDGPIKILVGMDTKGILTGVLVVEHHEPYGNFSVEPPKFAAQFKGRNVRDPFKVGVNVDAVSSATISVTSATRAIRNSALRVGRQLLTEAAK
jgi:NosR/NirI family transcriptional regulator, nitrous oxide reductase regulator